MSKKLFCAFITLTLFTLCLFSSSIVANAQSSNGKWWDKLGEPKYGGSINIRQEAGYRESFDPYNGIGLPHLMMFEPMFIFDWTADREDWSFKTSFVPEQFHVGGLAESWEQQDPKTLIVHLRKGVHFQNKPPVNGRVLTAEDVEANFDRELGTGHGYTKPNAWWSFFLPYFKKVTAIDKYTLKYEFNAPSALNLIMAMQQVGFNRIVPPEVFPPPSVTESESPGGSDPGASKGPGGDKGSGGAKGPGGAKGGGIVATGPLSDWKNAIGTGPWMLTDYVSQSSLTFSKNPDYWGHDERHPGNKIPYVDSVKALVIPDNTTALAALRTDKLTVLVNLDWQQASTLSKSNPELKRATIPYSGMSVVFKNDEAPFTDIRVRKALQMAVDRKLIAKAHYHGTVDGSPCGLIHPELKGYTLPFNEWPEDLKKQYSYNPEGAKKLLSEAGFPEGFKTDIIASNTNDLQLLQIIKSQFMEIGVDMEIRSMDYAQWFNIGLAGKHKGLAYTPDELGNINPPWTSLQLNSSRQPNFTFAKDPVYDGKIDKILGATTSDEAARLCTETDLYGLSQHWAVRICPTATFVVHQPYLKGYSGETIYASYEFYTARFWVEK